MEEIGALLSGIATVLWPILVIALLIILFTVFKPAITAIIESAKSRKFTLKIGGQEITMEEASKQQLEIFSDIQSQLVELRGKVEGNTEPISSLSDVSPALDKRTKIAILWVDDNPRNNSYQLQQLSDMDIKVDLALSTSDGLDKFSKGQYNLVISDMGRQERNSFNHTAGLDLLGKIRDVNTDLPFVICTTSANARKYASEAKDSGATLITSSWTKIMGVLLKELAKA